MVKYWAKLYTILHTQLCGTNRQYGPGPVHDLVTMLHAFVATVHIFTRMGKYRCEWSLTIYAFSVYLRQSSSWENSAPKHICVVTLPDSSPTDSSCNQLTKSAFAFECEFTNFSFNPPGLSQVKWRCQMCSGVLSLSFALVK